MDWPDVRHVREVVPEFEDYNPSPDLNPTGTLWAFARYLAQQECEYDWCNDDPAPSLCVPCGARRLIGQSDPQRAVIGALADGPLSSPDLVAAVVRAGFSTEDARMAAWKMVDRGRIRLNHDLTWRLETEEEAAEQ